DENHSSQRFQGKSGIGAVFCRMSKSSPSRQGKEGCRREGTAYAKPDSTGSIPRFNKALFNKQAKCKPNHYSSIGLSTLSPENFSMGCKYSVWFLESRGF
uniref:Uncharacterized protein n=1 Tax=Aotus nancymaae TaxID=37293 RepID=A0A2K5EBD1_AOTNA